MHGRIYLWLAWAPAVAAVLGLMAPANGQDGSGEPQGTDPGYSAAADATEAQAAPPVASNQDNQDANLAARLAEVEKILKKAEDKAQADKEAAAGKMTATPSGRIQLDTAAFSQDDVDKGRYDEQNGVAFRTARLAIVGGGFNIIKYQIEYDFATTTKVKCKDTFLTITDLPLLQNIQIGHFKEPYSLDELTSDNYITFMERSAADGVMAPKRHIGIMTFGNTEDQNATYALGYFAEKDLDGDAIQNDDMGGALTMRGTYLPWYDEATEGRGLIHTGLSYSHRDAFNHECTLAYQPECYLAKSNVKLLDDVSQRNEVGAELAGVYGPLSMQTEYYVNYIDRMEHDNCKTQGAYVYVSYFLTGENRPYDRTRGVFGRVKPFENFFHVRDENGCVFTGKGAWELKYRYSWFDGYDDGKLGFQTCGDHTVGLNWYLTPYTRFMFEYIHSNINRYNGDGAGNLDILQMRTAIDF